MLFRSGALAAAAIGQQSTSGALVLEAEAFTGRVNRLNTGWQATGGGNYSGGLAVAVPYDRNVNSGSADYNFVTTSPRLDYRINVLRPGTYYLWLRGLAPAGVTAGTNDSAHVGLDGVAVASADRISGFDSSLKWINSTMDGPAATIDITTAGLHTLNLYMRESGLVVDEILLTPSATFVPSGATATSELRTGNSGGPNLLSAFSRKTHGSAGVFDLGLSLNSSETSIEPRSGGANTLVFAFDQPIAAADGLLDASEFGLTGAAFASASISDNVLTLNLSGVVNARTNVITLDGLVGQFGVAMGSVTVKAASLFGDVNFSGQVNATDSILVKRASGRGVDFSTFWLDLSANGSINATDGILAKTRSGTALL